MSDALNPSLRIEISADEYAERARRVAAAAAERGLDALLVWSRGAGSVDRYANVLYLTNYYNAMPGVLDFEPMWTGQGNAACLITADGRRTLITNVGREEWADSYVHCEDFVDEPHLHLGAVEALRRAGLQRGRIGLVAADCLNVGLYQTLIAATADTRWEPADDILEDARRVKSPAEQAVIRQAVAAGDAMMEAMLAALVPGAREGDVHRAGWAAALERGVAPYDTPGASGPLARTFVPSTLPSWSERTLREGDLWHTDMYGVWHGYMFDFSRSDVAGQPSAEQAEMLEASVRVVERVIDAIRPGVRFCDAAAVGAEAKREETPGGCSPSRAASKHAYPHFGHTLGLGWENLWIYPGEQREFEAGMHVAVETTVGHPELGFSMFEQNLLVTPDGTELTSRCPARPWLERTRTADTRSER